MNPNDRLLFLKYALPCGQTLVKRGELSQGKLDSLIQKVSCSLDVPDAERIFKVAYAHCSLLAKRAGKPIDQKIIRQYFLEKHDEVIDKRFQEMRDFDPVQCQVLRGEVLEAGEKAVVKTPSGTREFRTDFAPDLERGDRVILHWDFVVEKANLSD
ncbi:MAG: hypothetical protein ISS93_03170 [Candidatus Aenigmarchaeota archaeon]|nr:hypothetical protein [Candidatus Aenigmarchaeota archaeon]